MAVNRLPSGVNVDMGFSDESPMDKLNKLLSAVGTVAAGVGAVRERREGNDVSSMDYLLQKIESSSSINELNQYKNQYSTIIDPNYVSDNNLYNLYKSEVDSKITSQENNLNDINKLASNFYIKMTSAENQLGTSLLNMDRDSIYNYYDSMSDEGKGGWLPELAKERYELQSLVELMDTTFKGKNPNSPINYVDADGKKQTVKMRDFRRLLNQYDDQMQALIDGGFEDGILSREEAMAISSITGRDNRTVDYFYTTREKKIADYKSMLQGATKNQNNVLNKTISLFNKKDTGNNAFQQAINQIISEPENTQNDLTQGVAAAANSKAVEENFPAELGQLEGLSTEEKYTKIMEAVTSGNMSKEKLMFLLQDAARENSDFEQMAIDGLKAWGGNSAFEYKKDPRDIAKELSQTGEPIIPGTTDQYGYATGMSIGETEEPAVNPAGIIIGETEEPIDDRQAVSEEVIDDRQAVSEEDAATTMPAQGVKDTISIHSSAPKDIDTPNQGPIQSFINEYKEEAAIATGTGIAASQVPKVREVTRNSINYLKNVINLPDEQIAKIYADSDVKKISKQLNDQLKKIDDFKKNLPIGVDTKDLKTGTPSFKKYQSLLKQYDQIIRNNAAKLQIRYPDINDSTLRRMLRNSNKWDLFRVKSAVATGMREVIRTPKDILKVLGKSGMTISPLEGALLGWYAGEKMDLGWKGQVATTVAGGYTMKKILQGVANRGGWSKAVMNPQLQSKIGKFLIKNAPGVAAKMGLKTAVAGAAQVFPGIGTAVGIGMGAWTLNDIKNLIQDFPEIKQYLVEYLEGEYDEPQLEE
jgi:hypothetical protein